MFSPIMWHSLEKRGWKFSVNIGPFSIVSNTFQITSIFQMKFGPSSVSVYCLLTIFIGIHIWKSVTLNGLLQFHHVHYIVYQNDRCYENIKYIDWVSENWITWIYYISFVVRPFWWCVVRCVWVCVVCWIHFMNVIMQCCLSRVKIHRVMIYYTYSLVWGNIFSWKIVCTQKF